VNLATDEGRRLGDSIEARAMADMYAAAPAALGLRVDTLAGTTLLLATAYQLTPMKNACLARCRSPLAFLLGSWRPGRGGALRMGLTHGAWCVGCCWALMAALFALGAMSIAWAALVAALVALEKLLPWRRVATWGTAALLVALGLLLFAAPGAVPALTLPAGGAMPVAG